MAVISIGLVYFILVLGMACLMWKLARVPFPPRATVLSTNGSEFPDEMRNDLSAVSAQLSALGFEATDAIRLDYGAFSTLFAVAFKRPGASFAVYHFEVTRQTSYVEFRTICSRYGSLISVAAWPTPFGSARPSAGLLLTVPPMPNDELLAFHEAARAAIIGDKALPVPSDMATHLLTFQNARFERAFTARIMLARRGEARFRWPYLLRFAVLTLPPFRFTESARNRSRARRVLSEVPAGQLTAIRSAMTMAERNAR
jgi:hypothetical protein